MTAHSLIQNTPFTTTEASAIASVRAKIDEIREIQVRTARDRWEDQGVRSWLHKESDRLGNAFAASPSLEGAEAYHQALVRCKDADLSGGHISDFCNAAVDRESAKLRSVMDGLFARIESTLCGEHDSARKALSKAQASPLVGDGLSSLDAKVRSLKADLATHREQALANPHLFLEQHGLCINDDEPQQAAKGKQSDDVVGAMLADLEN